MRHAENVYFLSFADKKEGGPDAVEAARAYQKVADEFPEFPNAGLARYGLALVQYRRGNYEEAKAQLEKIPAQDFNGELAYAPLVLADCLIRHHAHPRGRCLGRGPNRGATWPRGRIVDRFHFPPA